MIEFLSQKGVEYVEKNLRADKDGMKEFLALGFQSAPVTLIDGQSVMGFDRMKLVELLGL